MKTEFVSFIGPAKINLGLRILGKRPDGYHEIKSLMVKVSLYDHVAIRRGGDGISVACPNFGVPQNDKNFAYRAVEVFREEFGEDIDGLGIHIVKAIPVAAGLGGGSSDAAQVFKGLRLLFNQDIKMESLRNAAVRVGADVPFFLYPGAAWATGIGEQLECYDGTLPGAFILINPGVPVSSSWAYTRWDEVNAKRKNRLINEYPLNLRVKFEEMDWKRVLDNDLEAVVREKHPEVAAARRVLEAAGAPGVGMSGSGPVVFGVFPSISSAEEAADQVQKDKNWQVMIVKPVQE